MKQNEAIALDFKRKYLGKGKFTDEQVEKICVALAKADSATNEHVDCQCNIISALFYMNVMIYVYDDTHTKYVEKFDGNCGGIAIPGDSEFPSCTITACDGYTIQDVYDQTHSFECTSASIAVSIVFFNKNHDAIGHLEGGGAGSVIGEFGGTGSFKPC